MASQVAVEAQSSLVLHALVSAKHPTKEGLKVSCVDFNRAERHEKSPSGGVNASCLDRLFEKGLGRCDPRWNYAHRRLEQDCLSTSK